jgi:hypothetical protein
LDAHDIIAIGGAKGIDGCVLSSVLGLDSTHTRKESTSTAVDDLGVQGVQSGQNRCRRRCRSDLRVQGVGQVDDGVQSEQNSGRGDAVENLRLGIDYALA